jgi:hypothetical protein
LQAGNHLLIQGGGATATTLNLDPGQNFSQDVFLVGADGGATAGTTVTMVQNAFTVGSESDLNTVLSEIDAGGVYSRTGVAYTITFTNGFTLNTDLAAINLASGDSLTLAGAGQTIDGGGAYRGFLVYAGAVAIDDLTIQNAVAAGGAGGAGTFAGGGGAGLGGGLFVAAGASVSLSNVNFLSDSAIGGAGGAAGTGYGGGGGLGGAGGAGVGGYAGGGGGIGQSATGGAHANGGNGVVLGAGGASSGGGTYSPGAGPGAGGAFGGGGGAGGMYSGSGRDPRSFPGPAGSGGIAANGHFGGGAGSGELAGFGGGGAASNGSAYGVAGSGAGGFGGGGAGGLAGGFAAGNSTGEGGGGGAGLGGGVFVQQGGSLTIVSGGMSGGSAEGGVGSAGSANGQGYGAGIFDQGGVLDIAPGGGQTVTIGDAIADQAGSGGSGALSLVMSGTGGLALSATNTFTGGMTIDAGSVALDAAGAAGSGTITFSYGSTAELIVGPGDTPANIISGFLPGDSIDLRGVGVATSAVLGAGDVLAVTGGGVNLSLNLDPAQIFTGETFVAKGDGLGGTLLTAVTVGGDHPPSIAGAGVALAGNDAAPIDPMASVTVSDLDVGQTETATLTLSSTADGTLSNLGGGAYDASSGVYTVTGSAAAVTTALDGLVFTPVDHEVAPGQTVNTTFALSVTDGTMTAAAINTVKVTALNTPPTITGAGTWNYDGYFTLPMTPFTGVTITDPDLGATETVTLTLGDSGGYTGGNGTLALPISAPGVTLTQTGPGVYTLSSGSPTAITQALDAITFTPVAHPTPGFTITYLGISVSDGTATTSATDTVLAGAPVITGAVAGQTTTDTAPIAPFTGVVLTDSPGVASLSVTIQVTLPDGTTLTDADGVLSGAGLTKTGVGTYVLAAGSPAAVTAAVEALTFTPTIHQVPVGQSVTTDFTLSVADGASTSDNGTTTVIATSTGATNVWQGKSPTNHAGVWSTAADWSLGVTPGAADTVAISATGAYAVGLAQSTTIGNLVISDAKATLKIAAGQSLGLTGSANSSSNGTIALASAASLGLNGAFNNTGAITLDAGGLAAIGSATGASTLVNGAATVAGRIVGAGALGDASTTLVNQAKGIIDADAAAALVLNTGANAIANAGLIESTGTGGLTIDSAVVNTGTLVAHAGVLTVNGAVTGAGKCQIGAGTLDFASSFGGAVSFLTGSTGTLELAHGQTYAGKITGLSTAGANAIDLADIGFVSGTTTATYSGTASAGVLKVTDGTHTANLHLIGAYLGATWILSSDGHGGTKIVDPTKPASATGASPASPSTPPIHPFVQTMAGIGARFGAAASPVAAAWHASPSMLAKPGTQIA